MLRARLATLAVLVEPSHDKSNKMTFAAIEDLDQPKRSHSEDSGWSEPSLGADPCHFVGFVVLRLSL